MTNRGGTADRGGVRHENCRGVAGGHRGQPVAPGRPVKGDLSADPPALGRHSPRMFDEEVQVVLGSGAHRYPTELVAVAVHGTSLTGYGAERAHFPNLYPAHREGVLRGPEPRPGKTQSDEPRPLAAFRVRCDEADAAEADAAAVCHVMGNLEQETAADFRDAVTMIVHKKQVTFELSAVPFVDSAGLGALIGAVRRIRENGGDAVVCGAQTSVGKVFKLVGLTRVVTVVDTLDEAWEHSC